MKYIIIILSVFLFSCGENYIYINNEKYKVEEVCVSGHYYNYMMPHYIYGSKGEILSMFYTNETSYMCDEYYLDTIKVK